MGIEEKKMSGSVINCAGCGLPLIQRLPNGLWKFKWGIQKKINPETGEEHIDPEGWAPIEMYIRGNIRLKCFRKRCATWNDLRHLPNSMDHEVSDKIKVLADKISRLVERFDI